MDSHKRRLIIAALIVVIIAASSFSAFFAYRLFAPAPTYEFKTGINHPAVISNLLKNGTVVVLYFSMNNCPPCDEMPPKIADLQSQYKGTEVTILTLNVSDNATALQLARNYGIQSIPQVFVIRPDGAVANVTSENYPYIDFNVIRSAIEDARHGNSSNIFPF